MQKVSNITIRVDNDLKKQAIDLFDKRNGFFKIITLKGNGLFILPKMIDKC